MNTFSFGFADDDIGNNEQFHGNQQSDLPNTPILRDEERVDDERARLWNIQEFLEDFAPCQIDMSYTTLGLQSEESVHVPRRATFNWQMDLMASENAPPSPILRGTDLVPGFYEGGWQIWEGAKDLAEYLLKNINSIVSAGEGDELHVVELGAGLAIPSLTVFYHFLMNRKDSPSLASLKPHFTLSDYNASVLRHGTAPALFATWFLTKKYLSRSKAYASSSPPSDLELQPDDLEAFYKDMVCLDFNIDFISGQWGKEFVGLMTKRKVKRIVLASETIYSLETLPTFTSTLLGILRQDNLTEGSRAYVAAKRLYFGVGGGVDVFVRLVEDGGGAVKTVWEADQGVSRVILEVRGYR